MSEVLAASSVGPAHYAVLSAALLAVGLYVMMAHRNALGVLMGVELVLNAASLNFVAFGRGLHDPLDGQAVALFVMVLAAAEAAVALAILLAFFAAHRTADVDHGQQLQG